MRMNNKPETPMKDDRIEAESVRYFDMYCPFYDSLRTCDRVAAERGDNPLTAVTIHYTPITW